MKTCRVLIMEDEDDLRHLYSKALTKAGYEVCSAANLQSARNFLGEQQFDAFLCDIRIGKNELGTTLLREKLDTLQENDTRVIVLSCETQYRPLCEEMGVEFFLEKPVAIHAMITLVDRLTARHTN